MVRVTVTVPTPAPSLKLRELAPNCRTPAVAAALDWQAENYEVFPSGSVAVVVKTRPVIEDVGTVKIKVASPFALVVALVAATKNCPSPKPNASHWLFEKSSTR